jgi:hypothetical protein
MAFWGAEKDVTKKMNSHATAAFAANDQDSLVTEIRLGIG